MPEGKAQRNFTDPDSHIMPAPGGKQFEQAYNAQAAVDSAHQVIVAAEVTEQPSDRGQAVPMMEQVKANTGKLPRQMSADAGYFSSNAVKDLTADGIDVYMPPDKMHHAYTQPAAPRRPRYRHRAFLVWGPNPTSRGFPVLVVRASILCLSKSTSPIWS